MPPLSYFGYLIENFICAEKIKNHLTPDVAADYDKMVGAAVTLLDTLVTPNDRQFVRAARELPSVVFRYFHAMDLDPTEIRQVVPRFWLSLFAVSPPEIRLGKYMTRLVNEMRCDMETFVLVLVLLRRVSERGLPICSRSIHRVFFTLSVIVAKMRDDKYYPTSFYARIGGVRKQDVEAMEVSMLNVLGFDAGVSTFEYVDMLYALRVHCAGLAFAQGQAWAKEAWEETVGCVRYPTKAHLISEIEALKESLHFTTTFTTDLPSDWSSRGVRAPPPPLPSQLPFGLQQQQQQHGHQHADTGYGIGGDVPIHNLIPNVVTGPNHHTTVVGSGPIDHLNNGVGPFTSVDDSMSQFPLTAAADGGYRPQLHITPFQSISAMPCDASVSNFPVNRDATLAENSISTLSTYALPTGMGSSQQYQQQKHQQQQEYQQQQQHQQHQQQQYYQHQQQSNQQAQQYQTNLQQQQQSYGNGTTQSYDRLMAVPPSQQHATSGSRATSNDGPNITASAAHVASPDDGGKQATSNSSCEDSSNHKNPQSNTTTAVATTAGGGGSGAFHSKCGGDHLSPTSDNHNPIATLIATQGMIPGGGVGGGNWAEDSLTFTNACGFNVLSTSDVTALTKMNHNESQVQTESRK